MRRKILWVDDEIDILRSHIEFLESRGYCVTTASGGDEAVSLIGGGDTSYDIVLLDRQMPQKSGRATLESIRARCPGIPVVMLLGERQDSDAALLNYDGYITKPVDTDELLKICKRIINSRNRGSSGLSDRYFRIHTENRMLLSGNMSAADWISLYKSLVKWDSEIYADAKGSVCEGVRQMHAGLKSDSGRQFCDFVIENYTAWVRGGTDCGRPFMAVDVFGKTVIPELREGRSVLMLIMSGARFDEFQVMESELKTRLSAVGAAFVSALPTMSDFCLPPLLSGKYMDEVCESGDMARFMRTGLDLAGMESVRTFFAEVGDAKGVNCTNVDSAKVCRMVEAAASVAKKEQTFAVVVAYVNKAVDAGIDPVIGTGLLSTLKNVCNDTCTVILTSDHGRVSCSRASEVYEHGKVRGGTRCIFGIRASVDEREAFLLENPRLFRLPQIVWDLKCVMARENYYFTLSGAKRKPKIGVRCGGISLEETVMPIYVCRPRVD